MGTVEEKNESTSSRPVGNGLTDLVRGKRDKMVSSSPLFVQTHRCTIFAACLMLRISLGGLRFQMGWVLEDMGGLRLCLLKLHVSFEN